MRGLAGLLALLVALLPARAAANYVGRVSPHEFRSVQTVEWKWQVQHAWAANGVVKARWTDAGGSWQRKRYRTTEGRGTWVQATYRFRLTDQRWHLRAEQWCIWDDFVGTFTCKPHPWV